MLKNLKIGQPKPEQARVTTSQPQKPEEAISSPEDYSEADYSAEVSSTEAEPQHFDELINEAQSEDVPEIMKSGNMIGAEEFHSLFCVGFKTASHISGFKSLYVDENDGAAKACTEALYETIQDIPALHFILMPQGKWMQRAVAIGTFTIPMALGVAAEMKQKQPSKPKSEAKRPAQSEQPSETRMQTLKEMAGA